jgi:hypothetical protein
MLKRLNDALPGLVFGILLYGVLLQAIGVWLVEDKLRYSTGLWIGIACALFMAIHMAISIEDAVSLDEDGAKKKTIASAMLRYFVVLGVFVLTFYFNLGMVLPAFLGVLGLKISAYLQPFFEWLRKRYVKKRR